VGGGGGGERESATVGRIARHQDAPREGNVASSAVVVVGVVRVAPGLLNTASVPTETTSVAIYGSVRRCERDGMGLRAVNYLRFVSLCKLTKDASRIFFVLPVRVERGI